MEIYLKTTEFKTKKHIQNNLQILCLTDLHYTKNFNPNLLTTLLDKINELKPNYICFLGDLVDDDSYDVVINWLNSLAKIAPIYLIYGNHDLEKYRINNNKYRVSSYLPGTVKKEIRNINNLKILQNNQTDYQEQLCFCGTNFYHASQFDNFVSYLNHHDPKFKNENLNILLSHNPGIMKPEIFSKLSRNYDNTDLVLSGHTHNGLIPEILDEHIPGTTGLFLGTEGIFPKYTRNEVEIERNQYFIQNPTGIIVPPIRTLPDRGNLFNKVNDIFYKPGMQLIRIKKSRH